MYVKNTCPRGMLICIIFFTGMFMHGQVLHHQMISSQGNAKTLDSGYYVSQTIGQQSIIGANESKNFRAIQGFQQSAWGRLIAGSRIPEVQTITVYPNPFVETINFGFGTPVQEEITIQLFNVSGQLVYKTKVLVSDNLATLQLTFLPPGLYLVSLINSSLTYYTKILKK